MIRIQGVSAGYGGKEVLHQVSADFPKGKVTVLIGPNGCGKSTLLKTMIRLAERTQGEIYVNRKPLEGFSTAALAKQVAYLPQKRRAPEMTVQKMVLHGRFAHLGYPRRYRQEDLQMAERAICRVGLEEKKTEPVHTLSGGMQQNVYLAMVLAQDTEIVLLDEPTTYLDVAYQLRTMKLVREMADNGKTVVMVLHDLSQALRVADEVIVMNHGEIVCSGTPETIYQKEIVRQVFDVKMERVWMDNGWHYICM